MSRQDFRALIYAGDIAAVEALLNEVPREGREGQKIIRNVFEAFGERHPKTIAFTKEWLAQKPNSAIAMTARATSLYTEGFAMRGTAFTKDTHPARRAAFQAAHTEGLALMQAATKAYPSFLPASDGVIKMSYTIGQSDLIEPEVARIMAIWPNRYTLTLAGAGLAPNWGGSERDMKVLCRVYAPFVTDRPGYDAEVCSIDGAMQSNHLTGTEREALQSQILASDNPLISEWAPSFEAVPGDTPSARLAYLDGIKLHRPLAYFEARLYDQDAAQVAILAGKPREAEFPAALAREVAFAKENADANPGNWAIVDRYLNLAGDDRQLNGGQGNTDEIEKRMIASLRLLPYDPGLWSSIGGLKYRRLTMTDNLKGIAEAEPYFINAIAYSNHKSLRLAEAASVKLSAMVQAMMAGSLPVDPERWQSVVQCPMVRQLRLLMQACDAEERPFGECTGLPYEAENMQGLIRDVAAAGTCTAEATAPLEDLIYIPVEVVLPPE